MTAYHHVPVMADEVLEYLNPAPGKTFADGTLGGGGHSSLLLERMRGQGMLYGIDRDLAAIKAAGERLKDYPNKAIIHGNFHDIDRLLPEDVLLDGGLIDLGVSSHQLDTPERGFSYHEDAPLDMRMDQSRGITAADYLNTVSEKDFAQALYAYSDERWGARIAKKLVEMRKERPLQTTFDLVRVVDASIPKAVRAKDTGHPARRAFQAVRIAVNEELDPLSKALESWAMRLKIGGRLCVITFHSIEDRIVKQAFARMKNPCICPPKAPVCTCGKKPYGKVLGGGAIKPTKKEIEINSRSQSAKMRVVERI